MQSGIGGLTCKRQPRWGHRAEKACFLPCSSLYTATLRSPFCIVAPLLGAMSSMSTLCNWGATILTMLCSNITNFISAANCILCIPPSCASLCILPPCANPSEKWLHYWVPCLQGPCCVTALLPSSQCSAAACKKVTLYHKSVVFKQSNFVQLRADHSHNTLQQHCKVNKCCNLQCLTAATQMQSSVAESEDLKTITIQANSPGFDMILSHSSHYSHALHHTNTVSYTRD